MCREVEPDWREINSEHLTACHKVEPAVVA